MSSMIFRKLNVKSLSVICLYVEINFIVTAEFGDLPENKS